MYGTCILEWLDVEMFISYECYTLECLDYVSYVVDKMDCMELNEWMSFFFNVWITVFVLDYWCILVHVLLVMRMAMLC